MPLDELQLRVLEFEREWVARVGAKEAAIRDEFGLTPARYYQVLNAVLDAPAALKWDPLLVRRLQRLRDGRTRTRAARTFRTEMTGTTLTGTTMTGTTTTQDETA